MFGVFLLFFTGLLGGSYLYWKNQDNVDAKIYDRYGFQAGDSPDSSLTIGTVPIANAEGGVIPYLAVQTGVNCPASYTYNSRTKMCEKTTYTISYYTSCPSGTSYNSYTGKCETYPMTTTSCPSGTSYNSYTGKCETDPTFPVMCYVCNYEGTGPSCGFMPASRVISPFVASYCKTPTDMREFAFMSFRKGLFFGASERDLNCPSGTSYNSYTGKCETYPMTTTSCPSGTSYNSYTGKCETYPYITTYTREDKIYSQPTITKSKIRMVFR